MDTILISVKEPHEPELISFPATSLYLFPRQPGRTEDNSVTIWRQLRDLVYARCGGEVALLDRDGLLLFYPNHHTPLLAALLTEPAFFDFLETHDYDGRAVQLFFHHSYRWSGLPWRPKTVLAAAEAARVAPFNRALQQMGRYTATPHPVPETAPQRRLLCTTVPPMDWFLKKAATHFTPADVCVEQKITHHLKENFP